MHTYDGLEQSPKRKSSIRAKLLKPLLSAVIIAIVIIAAIVYNNTSSILLSRSKTILNTNSSSVINEVSGWINTNLAELKAERSALEYIAPANNAVMKNYLKSTVKKDGTFPDGMYVGKTDGSLVHPVTTVKAGFDSRERDWYKTGIHAENFTLGPVYKDVNSQQNVVSASGELKNKSGQVIGVTSADISLKTITGMVQPVTIEKTGGVFLVDKSSKIVIGAKDTSAVGVALDQENDNKYHFVSKAIQQNQTGIQNDKSGNENLYMDIESVPGSNWVAVSYAPRAEIMHDLSTLTRSLILISIIAIIVLICLISVAIRQIVSNPVKEIDATAQKIAAGKLDEKLTYHSNDELGELSDNFNKTVSRLRNYVNYIDEISSVLNEIANNNLNYHLKYDYSGEFAKVKQALENISNSLNKTLGSIQQSAEQVASGSDQVSAGAQSLSQGATEQASSVEELASTIDSMSKQIQDTADKASNANQSMDSVRSQLLASNEQMQEMIQAMGDISDNSDQISKIIKTIEDIAFQTNILALNAAVEAARAGEAGKGFSVVADEVRTLASKSAEASKNTAALIDRSLHSVKHGSQIADKTAQSLMAAVDGTKEIVERIVTITNTAKKQATSIQQVTQGVDQISSVIQTTSATSEESAAASEELSGQAEMLKKLVNQFQLKSNAADSAASTPSASTAPIKNVSGTEKKSNLPVNSKY